MKFDLNQHLQQRRKSFPPQKHITYNMTTTTPCKSSQSTNNISSVDMDANRCPLTEDNLAIHTRNFPPSKDARRLNCRLFVESQIPVVEMELKLQQQREREISNLEVQQDPTANIEFANPFHDPNAPLEEERSRRSKWFTKLKHWIRMDSGTKQNKTRHLSWSAGTEKEDHKMVDSTACQKRDSGISIFSNNNHHGKQRRRSSPIAAIPITRQPKFSPSNDPHEELITYQYPRMRRKSGMIHAAVPAPVAVPAFSDDKNDNYHAVEKSPTSAVPTAICCDCKGSQQGLFKLIQQGAVV
ncbi:hypothetical protein MAM1_0012d01285 [Mucor ambiguus]|uniref:Uncharacterized protein n=1 Tax=Mucor ambiguus TaxID=91626 RepID=A0A0C9LR12_9FUNG|nr:hypothetical protein MAM1_0012d01285 [Mucor ambiguus]